MRGAIKLLLALNEGVGGIAALGADLALWFDTNQAYKSSGGGVVTPASILTVVRASKAWDFNSAGVLTEYANNALAYGYNPATLAPKGVGVWRQSTNLLLNVLLDGTSLSTQSVTVTAADHTLSFYGTGTVTLSGVSTAGPLVGTGANNRVSLTFTPTAGTLTLTVSGSVKFANLELGSIATSPIITAGSQVTRAADQISILTSAFTFSATAGTMASVGTAPTANGAHGNLVEAAASGSNRIAQYVGGTYLGMIVTAAGVSQAVLAPAITLDDTTFHKTASAWAANNFATSLNGAAVLTDTSGSIPTVDALWVGRQASVYLDGYIKRLAYYASRKTNAELQVLST